MEKIARLVVATTDLVEAEGRALKRTLGRLFLAAGAGVVALVFVLAGLGFLVAGLLMLLAKAIGVAWATVVFGLIALALAAVGAVVMKRLFAGPAKPNVLASQRAATNGSAAGRASTGYATRDTPREPPRSPNLAVAASN